MRARFIVVVLLVIVAGVGAVPVAGAVLDALDCNGCVDTADLHANAVTSSKIAGNGVKNADLADKAVTRAKIKNRSVSHNKLATRVMMAASVNSNGALISATANVTSARSGVGAYEVTFPVAVVDCVVQLTSSVPLGEWTVDPIVVNAVVGTPTARVVSVVQWNTATDSLNDGDVSIAVTCP
jgi:hypothetical protein